MTLPPPLESLPNPPSETLPRSPKPPTLPDTSRSPPDTSRSPHDASRRLPVALQEKAANDRLFDRIKEMQTEISTKTEETFVGTWVGVGCVGEGEETFVGTWVGVGCVGAWV